MPSDLSPQPPASPNGPLTSAEIADRLAPGQVQMSADGRNAAFVVAPGGKKKEHLQSAVWLSRDGLPAEQFTGGSANDTAPRCSPDGRRLLFLSDRAEPGKLKLYVMRLDGGEALPVGEIEGELSAPSWSPDGAQIAVLLKDSETKEEKKRKEDRDDAEVVDGLPTFKCVHIVAVEGGVARQLTYGSRQVWSFGWSRDGERLAIATTEEPSMDATCGSGDLWTIPVAGGAASHVARFPTLPDSPVWVDAGDGPRIAVRANDHRADPVDSVWLAPADGGAALNLVPGFDGNVDGLGPVAGRPGILALRIVSHVQSHAYLLDVATTALTQFSPTHLPGDGTLIDGPSFSDGGERMAVIWADGAIPDEVYVGPGAGPAAAVSSLGAAYVDRLSPVERVVWNSDGWEIEGLLTYPAGYRAGERYPLVLEAHGGPSLQWEDRCFLDWHDWAQFLASRGYFVLAPNPRGSTGRGAEFQRQLQDDVGGGEIRDLTSGVQAMVERGLADPERLGIGGWSWGGYLTATAITQTTMFKAAMMGAGLADLISDHGSDDIPSANLLYFPGQPYTHSDLYWRGSAIKNVADCTTPTLILHGDADARVHWTQGAEMYRALKTLGVPTEFVKYPREGHPIKERHHQIDLLTRLAAWFDKYLKA
ncbi:MAG: prolyl oligopeptidase family serine peptidase [Thermomicrobiales bacterium]